MLKGGSKDRERSTCQKTEYKGELGEVSGSRKALLL